MNSGSGISEVSERSCKPKDRACRPKKRSCRRKKLAYRPKKQGCRPKYRKQGPVMNSGYPNFVRAYREKHCDLKPRELMCKAARCWSRLSQEKRDKYRRMASPRRPRVQATSLSMCSRC